MDSFRNRLLALIIGLVVITQSVTLVAVLASTAHQVRERADGQLRSGAQVVQQFMRLRASQLASTVGVLAADFGFKDAVASHDNETMLSAATEHSKGIGWDLVIFLDADGRLLTSNSAYVKAHAPAVQKLVNSITSGREDVHLVVLGDQLYEFFVAPIRAPETIGWVAMGFAVDDELAGHIRDLVGAQVSVLTGDGAHLNLVASTLPPDERAGLTTRRDLVRSTEYSQSRLVRGLDSLTYVSRLGDGAESAAVVLQQPMADVMAPYRAQRNALLGIGGVAFGAALAV